MKESTTLNSHLTKKLIDKNYLYNELFIEKETGHVFELTEIINRYAIMHNVSLNIPGIFLRDTFDMLFIKEEDLLDELNENRFMQLI